MSGRKISSESFSSTSSDYPDSPEDAGCPFSRLLNGKSSVSGSRSAARRRVNLDCLGASIRKLVFPTPQTLQWALQRTLHYFECQETRRTSSRASRRGRKSRVSLQLTLAEKSIL